MKRTLRGSRFLLVDSFTIDPDKPRILSFCSDEGIALLRDNRQWSLDGTFHSVCSACRSGTKCETCSLVSKVFLPNADRERDYRAVVDASRVHPLT